jgi:hypothetical protein
MVTARYWSADRLAAANLLTQLKLDAPDDVIDTVARHFSDHRRSMVQWAGERTQSAIVEAMEAASTGYFAERSEDWVRGFCQAEEIIFTLNPKELAELEPAAPRTQGQILRSMVREARRS